MDSHDRGIAAGFVGVGAGLDVGALPGLRATGGNGAAVSRDGANGGACRGTRRPKPKRRLPPKVLTDDDVRALLGACGAWTPTGLGNRALITLMYRAGFRVSVALALLPLRPIALDKPACPPASAGAALHHGTRLDHAAGVPR